MVICALLPLLQLRAALGEAVARLREPVALAPPHDGPRVIGEVSPPARAFGLTPGTSLGEAVEICPELGLITPDPTRAEAVHEGILRRLEGIGAAVESSRPGEAFFRADGLDRLHGGLGGVLAAARRGLGPAPRLAAAPTRLAALAAALEAEPGEAVTVEPARLRGHLAALPVTILAGRLERPGGEEAVRSMRRLGLKRLGDLAALSRDHAADRFGPVGLEARGLARGEEAPLRPRPPREEIVEQVELPEAASGRHLQGGIAILCDRLSGRLRAAGLVARAFVLDARLSGGGSWSREAFPRHPTASSQLMRTLLSPAVEGLPRPAERLRLRAVAPAPADPEQFELDHRPERARRRRLDEAARQVRAVVGERGLMRVLDAEADSRLPERRMLLTPYRGAG